MKSTPNDVLSSSSLMFNLGRSLNFNIYLSKFKSYLFCYSSFTWMIDFSKNRVMCEGHSGCKDNQLILHDNFVVLNTVRDMTQVRQFASNALVVAKIEDGKPNLVNLWHQFPSDESIGCGLL
jgi:hypothetical protein